MNPNQQKQDRMMGGSALINNVRAIAGQRPLRYNRMYDQLGNSPLILRVPKDVMANEHNVLIGLPRTAYAPGATLPMSVNATRECIVRDLVCIEVSLAVGAVGTRDYTLQTFTIESETLALAVGTPIDAWSPFSRNRSSIDLPWRGGNPAQVTWTNNSAVAGVLAGSLYID